MALAVLAAGSLFLAGCGAEDPEAAPSPSESATAAPSASPSAAESPSASPSPSVTVSPSSDLEAITVTGEDRPEISLSTTPWAVDETRTKVLREGGDQKVAEDSTVTVHYEGVNARTGEMFDSSWERGMPTPFQLQSVVPGFQKGLAGQSVGSRVLIAMPSEDGYAQGNPNAGIEVGDTLIFVVDILSANFDEATGEEVEPAEGLPAVTMSDAGPELAAPEGEVPEELVVQPLIEGAGAEVTAESVIQVKYRSWVWEDGRLWEDAWQPQQGPLNTLIAGWKEGLVGQTTGSRVMLVVPPEQAYPDGVPSKDLDPGQTLVYVIDLLHVS